MKKEKEKHISKLKMLLLKRGISQTQLKQTIDKQNKIGIEHYSVSNIVNAKGQDIRISTVLKICRALSVSPNEILDYEPIVKLKK